MKTLLAVLILWLPSLASAKAYIGVEANWRFNAFKTERLGELYSDGPQCGFVSGYYLNEFFSVEFGAHASKTDSFKSTASTHQLRGYNLGLVAFAPLKDIKLVYGAALSHLKSVYRCYETKFHIKKCTPRFMVGLQLDPHPNFDIRISVSMEKISKLRHKHPGIIFQPRDTFVVGSGLFYKF